MLKFGNIPRLNSQHNLGFGRMQMVIKKKENPHFHDEKGIHMNPTNCEENSSKLNLHMFIISY